MTIHLSKEEKEKLTTIMLLKKCLLFSEFTIHHFENDLNAVT
jgi:hypothetical protein